MRFERKNNTIIRVRSFAKGIIRLYTLLSKHVNRYGHNENTRGRRGRPSACILVRSGAVFRRKRASSAAIAARATPARSFSLFRHAGESFVTPFLPSENETLRNRGPLCVYIYICTRVGFERFFFRFIGYSLCDVA